MLVCWHNWKIVHSILEIWPSYALSFTNMRVTRAPKNASGRCEACPVCPGSIWSRWRAGCWSRQNPLRSLGQPWPMFLLGCPEAEHIWCTVGAGQVLVDFIDLSRLLCCCWRDQQRSQSLLPVPFPACFSAPVAHSWLRLMLSLMHLRLQCCDCCPQPQLRELLLCT